LPNKRFGVPAAYLLSDSTGGPSFRISPRLAAVFLTQSNRTKVFHVKRFCPIAP